ncbi:MAG: nicotinate-nucleotide--dimethylbenzimidazole phosphoribosyltransferase [Rhodospirillales bacterium]
MSTSNGAEPEVSLDEIAALVREFPGPDLESATKVLERDRLIAKPKGGLGRLEALAEWLATWQARHPPKLERPAVCIFAGNHGIALSREISSRTGKATAKKVAGYSAGLGAVNSISQVLDADLRVFELALDSPTADFTKSPAMTDAECAKAMAYGMMAVEQGVDAIVLGQLGVGGDVAAAALFAAFYEEDPSDWLAEEGDLKKNKANAASEGVLLHSKSGTSAFQLLARLGGLEIAAMAGAIVAARMGRVPVILDGLIPAAAAAVVEKQVPGGSRHCILGHVGTSAADQRLTELYEAPPILELGINVGEGAGAALAVHVLRAAADCHSNMGTRAELDKGMA